MLHAEIFRAVEQLVQLAVLDAVDFVAGALDLRAPDLVPGGLGLGSASLAGFQDALSRLVQYLKPSAEAADTPSTNIEATSSDFPRRFIKFVLPLG
jgi:hypothetical protein